ncbi:MAG: hypothetical protein L0191_18130, partial [Acidobacteria bacterium]|nr:hypothetical protein [Acidobacteriota bacterium]
DPSCFLTQYGLLHGTIETPERCVKSGGESHPPASIDPIDRVCYFPPLAGAVTGGTPIAFRKQVSPLLIALGLSLVLLCSDLSPLLAQGEIPTWQPPKTGVGFEVDMDRPAGERPGPILAREVQTRGAQPLYVRILFSWGRLEAQKGVITLDELDTEVDRFREAGFEVILVPRGGNEAYGSSRLPAAADTESLAAWRAFLRVLAERFRGRVRFYQISDSVDDPGALPEGAGGREYAFLLKNAAVEVRGADPAAFIVMGSISGGSTDFLEAVLGEDVSAYLDMVALRGEAGVDPSGAVDRVLALLLQYDPSASVWIVSQGLPQSGRHAEDGSPESTADSSAGESTPPADRSLRAGAMIEATASALSSGARLVLFEIHSDPTGAPELGDLLVLLRRLFLPSLGPSPEGVGRLRLLSNPGGQSLPLRAWRFFDASTFQVLLVYVAPQPQSGSADLILDTSDVTGAVIDDLVSNTEKPVISLKPEASGGATRVEIPLSEVPL